jgi:hypothetical protein
MSGTTPGSYLVIARYGPANWAKWKNTPLDRKLDARSHAMDLFPLEPDPLPPAGMQVAHAFHTGIFTEIPNDFPEKPEAEQIRILDSVFTTQRDKAPGTDEKDPSVGWVALIDAARFSSFVERMGGRAGPLWQMYDIEVIPLNNDQNTKDIYDFMTTIHWAAPLPSPPAPA